MVSQNIVGCRDTAGTPLLPLPCDGDEARDHQEFPILAQFCGRRHVEF
jgi:hypothetical protein